ncbi:MAG: hypothetical protein MRY83_01515 [Flavobacteriales bacterium]|nr:hypothetical protein [Flavobacteriales bacterium]
MLIEFTKNIETEIIHYLLSEEIDFSKRPVFGLNSTEIIQYLTIGGGFISLANCIISFLKVNKQLRTVKVIKSDGESVEASGLSKDEVIELLKVGEKILFEGNLATEEE